MKKHWLLPIFTVLFSSPVFAANNIGETMYKYLGWIAKINWNTVNFLGVSSEVFFAKFLLWIAIFTTLFYAARNYVFNKTGQKKFAVVLAIVISLIAVLGIPNRIIKELFQLYSAIIIVLFIGLPIFGVYMLTLSLKKDIPQHPRVRHIMNAIFFYLCLVALRGVNEGIKYNWNLFQYEQWMGFAFALCELLMVYNILAMFFYWDDSGAGVRRGADAREVVNVEERADNTAPTGPDAPAPRPAGPLPPLSPRVPHPTDNPNPPVHPPRGVLPHDPNPPPELPDEPKIPDAATVNIDLTPGFSGIRNQTPLGSCLAFAGSSIFEYNRHVFLDIPKHYLSPLFLYYMARKRMGSERRDSGLFPSEAFDSMKKDGVCFDNVYPYDSRIFAEEPHGQAKSDALKKLIEQAVRVNPNDPDQWVHQLNKRLPVLIAVNCPDEWDGNYSKRLFDTTGSISTRGLHAMVIVAYRSHYPHEGKGIKAFKVRNSWGVNWADNGYVWVPANTLKELCVSAYVITGHKKGVSAGKYKVSGRVVFDDGHISVENSGKQIFDDKKIESPDHSFIVGALAQINGQVKILNNVPVKDEFGKFKFSFDVDMSKVEKPLFLRDVGIDGSKLNRGIVIFKTTPNSDDTSFYFHVADIEKFSTAGRGGFGSQNPTNPFSTIIDSRYNVSGIPIAFSNDHLHEENVVIPIPIHKGVTPSEKTDNFKELITKGTNQLGALITYLKKTQEKVKDLDFDGALELITKFGRTESRANREIGDALKHIPSEYSEFKDTIEILSNALLKLSSRYTGKISEELMSLDTQKGLMDKIDQNENKEEYHRHFNKILITKKQVLKEISDSITTGLGLIGTLKKIINL